ncbi:MAG: twin-arginine translocase TatA/TatE family subunit [Alistipes sp.]|nr:twin-arginine translocase TatA/TatE family subunit [Alistipes sp.]
MEFLLFGLGTSELIVIGLVILLLFGGAKLPSLMRGMGRGVREFKEGMNTPIEEQDRKEAEKNK